MKKTKYFYRVIQNLTNLDGKKDFVLALFFTNKKEAMKKFNALKKRGIKSHLAYLETILNQFYFDIETDKYIETTILYSCKLSNTNTEFKVEGVNIE